MPMTMATSTTVVETNVLLPAFDGGSGSGNGKATPPSASGTGAGVNHIGLIKEDECSV